MRAEVCLALLASALLILSGCATGGSTTAAHDAQAAKAARYSLLAGEPVPASWHDGAKWVFRFSNGLSQPREVLQLEVTDEPARTACLDGNWKKLRVLEQVAKTTYKPAYELRGRTLHVLLYVGLCDSYNELRGEFDEHHFLGMHQHEGMLGTVDYGAASGDALP